MFFAPLRVPSRIKKVSSASSADSEVFFAALSGPSWIKRCSSRPFACLRG